MIDRRQAPRFSTNIHGVLIFTKDGEKRASSCKILDLSEGGARIGVANVEVLPITVALFESMNNNIYECQIRWRKPSEAGLQFLDIVNRTLHKELMLKISRISFDGHGNAFIA